MRFWAREVAAATGGTLIGEDVVIDGTSFDSRTMRPGGLFVPLIGQRDGHEFIDEAMRGGAAATLTSRRGPLPPSARSGIRVDDTLQALLRLAAGRRLRSPATVIGITGSVGKTSTKDFAHAALSASRRTWASERSFNNDQGLPTTMLNAPDDTEVMVLEMGMRGFGEISRLCAVARPQIGVVTRVAEAHGDRVGGIGGVARAKAELVEALPAEGTAILNGDDPAVRAMAERCAGSVLTVGEQPHNDITIVDVRVGELATTTFTLASPWGSVPVALAVAGRHMIANAAAAIACVGAVGGDIESAARAVAEVRLTAMRMELGSTPDGAVVVNDAYNANPTSMRAALEALTDLPGRRRFAVLGLMAEISDAPDEHRGITAFAEARDIAVIAVGTELYGVAPTDDPVAALGTLGDGDVVLVKGSRVAGLERVAARLISG